MIPLRMSVFLATLSLFTFSSQETFCRELATSGGVDLLKPVQRVLSELRRAQTGKPSRFFHPDVLRSPHQRLASRWFMKSLSRVDLDDFFVRRSHVGKKEFTLSLQGRGSVVIGNYLAKEKVLRINGEKVSLASHRDRQELKKLFSKHFASSTKKTSESWFLKAWLPQAHAQMGNVDLEDLGATIGGLVLWAVDEATGENRSRRQANRELDQCLEEVRPRIESELSQYCSRLGSSINGIQQAREDYQETLRRTFADPEHCDADSKELIEKFYLDDHQVNTFTLGQRDRNRLLSSNDCEQLNNYYTAITAGMDVDSFQRELSDSASQ